MSEKLTFEPETVNDKPVVIVRLTTSVFSTRQGIIHTRKLSFLRRKSSGYNFLEEDISQVGASEVLERVVNFNDCRDGVFRLVVINEKQDWESGMVEDWEYLLVREPEQISPTRATL